MKTKSLFKSRSAILAILTAIAGGLGIGSDAVGQFITQNASFILVALGVGNLILRRLTKDAVTLFPPDNTTSQGGLWWD